MKTRHFLATLLGVLVSICLTSCASWDAGTQEKMLSAAGFRMKTPETPDQQAIYDAMDSYKLVGGVVNGERLFAYKHEGKGLVYVGREQEYQRYQSLAVQRDIAQQQYMAAQMNQSMAYRWSSWGPAGRYWW